MANTAGSRNNHSGSYKHPFSGLSIRQLLLIAFGVLCFAAVIVVVLNANQAYRRYKAAEHSIDASRVTLMVLSSNKLLAEERGFTAGVIARPAATDDVTVKEITRLRNQVDQSIERLAMTLEKTDNPHTHSALGQIKSVRQRLESARKVVDRHSPGDEAGNDYTSWVADISQCIDDLRILSRNITNFAVEIEYSEYDGALINEIFLTINENLGQERLLLNVVLAQRRVLNQVEREKLVNTSYHRKSVLNKLEEVMKLFPETPDIVKARRQFEQVYMRDFQDVRASVIKSSSIVGANTVSSDEWFFIATETVNALYQFSAAVNKYLNHNLTTAQNRARLTAIVMMLSLLVFLMALGAFLWVVYHRINRPLDYLAQSARVIADGDFSQEIQVGVDDEFGKLGAVFELMRKHLIDDRERQQKAEMELRKLSAAVEQSSTSVVIRDTEGIIEYANAFFYQNTGYQPSEIIGHKASFMVSEETPEEVFEDDLWQTVKRGEVWRGEICNKRKNGELFWNDVTVSPVRNSEGVITHYISTRYDITERKCMEERLNFLAMHDELTGLFNRTFMADRFSQMVADARRTGDRFALMMLDLDNFKLINDNLGHCVGDQLLVECARRLNRHVRKCDTLTRYGGDEFTLLLDRVDDMGKLTVLAQRLLDSFIEPIVIEQHTLHISVSIGISIWPDDGEDSEALLAKADTAMYQAKKQGRNRFEFFSEDMSRRKWLRLRNEMRNALVNREFELYYQPEFELASGKLVGAEALIRWNHPELGQISPLEFIPIAEDANLIQPIGEWVIETACAQLQDWQKTLNQQLFIAINVSVRQLESETFLPFLENYLKQSGLTPASVELEITESAVMQQPDKMREVLAAIKKLELKLALDDFGTGYSSLSYLRRFPFDKLKIDRSFIQDIADKPQDAAITKSMIEMAHHLDMVVIAEGIETEYQSSYMLKYGCDEIQGYLMGRPVPASEFHQFFNCK